MTYPIIAYGLSIALVAMGSAQSEAEDQGHSETSDLAAVLQEQVFDPNLYFGWPTSSDITIEFLLFNTHPAWSMGASYGCLNGDFVNRTQTCPAEAADWTFRLIELPAEHTVLAARRYEQRLISATYAGLDVVEALEAEPPRWKQATLTECPSAHLAFESFTAGSWLPANHPARENPSDIILMTGHPIYLEVKFRTWTQTLEFSGNPHAGYDDDPTARAVALYDALQDCWEPSPASWPWETFARLEAEAAEERALREAQERAEAEP